MESARPGEPGFDQSVFVRDFILEMPVTGELGIEVDQLSPGQAIVSLDLDARHTVEGTTVQAGITAMVADFAGVAAAASSLPDGWAAVTTGFSVHHLAPAVGERLEAVGRLVKGGRRSLVAVAEAYAVTGSERTHCLTGIFTATGLPPGPDPA